MMAGVEFLGDDPCTEQEESTSNYVCQYFAVTKSSNVKEGGAKNVEKLIKKLHHSFMRMIPLNVAASSSFCTHDRREHQITAQQEQNFMTIRV